VQLYGDMAPAIYIARLHEAVSVTSFKVGIIKAPFMALAIGIVACSEGLRVNGSVESLGKQTTTSVVKSIFLVVVPDGLFALFFCIDRNVMMQEEVPEFAVRVRDLVVGFGRQIVIDHLSLDVVRGEILGPVGASGGGKTVLMRTIIGLISPRSAPAKDYPDFADFLRADSIPKVSCRPS
jgi:ABC-type multidrug transport system fused ATPase/permease subunit